MQVINKKIIVIFICLGIFIFGLFKLFNKEKTILDEVKLDIRDTNNTFAIYLENEYKSNDYKESDNNEFPKIGYQFNKEKSQCVSINGDIIDNILSYDNETNKVVVDTTESISCYLYFDRLTLGDAIKKLNPKGLNSEKEGGLFRFQGSIDNVDNYVCLGSECQNEDDNMYRILGIDENDSVKLLKETSIGYYAWHGNDNENVGWNESDLFKRLNTNDDSFLNKLPENIQNMIEERDWLYGDIDYVSLNYTPEEVYKVETGEKQNEFGHTWKEPFAKPLNERTTSDYPRGSVQAKIGLMYVHDYYYSVQKGGLTCSSAGKEYAQTCYNGWIRSVDSLDNILTSLPYMSSIKVYGKWVIYYRNSSGWINDAGNQSNRANTRPVFYLRNNLLITKGDGTKDNPFIIN